MSLLEEQDVQQRGSLAYLQQAQQRGHLAYRQRPVAVFTCAIVTNMLTSIYMPITLTPSDVLTPVLLTSRLGAPGFVLGITSLWWSGKTTVQTKSGYCRRGDPIDCPPTKQTKRGRTARCWNPKRAPLCYLKATPGGAPPRLIGAQ